MNQFDLYSNSGPSVVKMTFVLTLHQFWRWCCGCTSPRSSDRLVKGTLPGETLWTLSNNLWKQSLLSTSRVGAYGVAQPCSHHHIVLLLALKARFVDSLLKVNLSLSHASSGEPKSLLMMEKGHYHCLFFCHIAPVFFEKHHRKNEEKSFLSSIFPSWFLSLTKILSSWLIFKKGFAHSILPHFFGCHAYIVVVRSNYGIGHSYVFAITTSLAILAEIFITQLCCVLITDLKRDTTIQRMTIRRMLIERHFWLHRWLSDFIK